MNGSPNAAILSAAGIHKRFGALVVLDDIDFAMREPAGHQGVFVKADISSKAGVDDLVARLPPRLDALCNVAGLSGSTGAVSTLAVNFYGLRALSEALAPKLREGGAIVNVASIAGFGWRANLNRAASMVGIEGFPDVANVVADHDFLDDGLRRDRVLAVDG